MIDIEEIKRLINNKLDGTEYFLVSANVSRDNEIRIEIDSDNSIDIDYCAQLSRYIEASLDREKEDFELEVGSCGLTAPLKLVRQYKKNIGNEVAVLTCDGRKLRGTLVEADDEKFKIEMQVKERREGDKRPKLYIETLAFAYDEVKQVTYQINFK